jgi:signal transduction histidine kinase
MSYKIIIVEDAIIVAKHLKRVLENNGYEVVNTFVSGEELLEYLKGHLLPDLIFMDIMLAGDLDGIQTTQQVMEMGHVPVIYLTALTDRATILRAKHTTPFGYIIKPFEEHALLTTLEMARYKFETEEALKLSTERFATTVHALSEGIITIDSQLKVNFINKAASQMLDIAEEEALDHPIDRWFQVEHLTTGEKVAIYPDTSQLPEIPERCLLVSRGGKKTPIGHVEVISMYRSVGELMGAVVKFQDITAEMAHEQFQREKELARLSALIEGQEIERARVSRELHDGIGQLLNAIKYSYHDEMGHTPGSQVSRLINETIHETSRISENLLPSKLRNFSLKTCIASLCSSNPFNTTTIINFDSNDEDIDLELSKKVNVFRIAQEGITNAMKYAQATMVSVQLYRIEDKVVLTIEDDGKGFDLQAVQRDVTKNHHGLQNMVDRVEIMRGTIEIDSKPELGTIISVEIPYENSENFVGG